MEPSGLKLESLIGESENTYFCWQCGRSWRKKEPMDPRNIDYLNNHALDHRRPAEERIADGSEERPW